MRKTILFGDSLTAGRIGIAYRRYMPIPTEAHGIEGETWSAVMKRVERYLKAKNPGNQTTIIIQGGANDLLLPYMAGHYPAWKDAVVSTRADHSTDEGFRENVHKTLQQVTDAHPHVTFVLCSIPILGERLDSELNLKMRIRNGSMESVAGEFENVVWCDITSPLEQSILDEKGNSDFLPGKPADLAKDVKSIGTDESKAAAISVERNLIVTIDGIHPNALGAQRIASAILAVLP